MIKHRWWKRKKKN